MTWKPVLILAITIAPFFRDVWGADPVALASAQKVLLAHGVNPEKAVLYDGELVLRMGGLDLTEIGFLSGLPVQILELAENYRLTNIDALASMPLRELDTGNTAVQSISSLSGCPIEQLLMVDCIGAPLTDLSPLAGMPIEYLYISQHHCASLAAILHHFVGIRRINMVYAEDIPGSPGSEEWVQGIVKALDGKFKAALRQ